VTQITGALRNASIFGNESLLTYCRQHLLEVAENAVPRGLFRTLSRMTSLQVRDSLELLAASCE